MTFRNSFCFCLFIILFNANSTIGQSSQIADSPAFDEKVSTLLDYSIPVISVSILEQSLDQFILLDTREKEEFDISHIEGAIWVGYDDFELSRIAHIDKNQGIVLYCSIGYRSEKIGKELKNEGYTKVYNLFGSIFEWVHSGNEIVDNLGRNTKKIHTYNKEWSQWMMHPDYEKKW